MSSPLLKFYKSEGYKNIFLLIGGGRYGQCGQRLPMRLFVSSPWRP